MTSAASINSQKNLPVSSFSSTENVPPPGSVSLIDVVDELSTSSLLPLFENQGKIFSRSQSFSDDQYQLASSKKAGLIGRKFFANETDKKELKKIVKHPHIQAHPIHWLVRFASADSSPLEIAQNIYNAMEKQQGRILCLSSGVEKKEGPHPLVISFQHYHDLYEKGRRIRYDAYRGAIAYKLEPFANQDAREEFRKLDPSEGTFSEEAIQFLTPDFLLSCAVHANYWEDISLLVKKGGTLPDFGKKEYKSLQGSEWISIYRAAYHANYGYFPDEEEPLTE